MATSTGAFSDGYTNNELSNLESVEVKVTNFLDPDGEELLERYRQEIIANYPAAASGAPSADDVPVFLILKMKGVPVACAGLRLLEEATHIAEIKRMYVAPECRGRGKGVADELMRQLEVEAGRGGWSVLRLTTGVEMPQARRFYER